MALTLAQKLTLRTHIQANTTVLAFGGGNATIADTFNAASLGSGDAFLIAEWYMLQASPDFFVWRTSVPLNEITDAIDWAKLTPAQAIPTTPQLDVLVWTAKAMLCQGKQFNLQNLLLGRASIDASRANIRSAFQDSLTGVPSKNDGTNQAAGWAAVEAIMKRLAKNIEKVFATGGNGDSATPATLGFEGVVTGDEISDIKGLPA